LEAGSGYWHFRWSEAATTLGDDAMSELISLKATARPRAGKGAARQARRDGTVPAVIYGNKKTPVTIALEYNALWKQVLKGHFTSTAIELDVDGAKHIVLARDVQVDPIRDTPLHVDFQRVGDDGVIRVAIPVHFVHEALSPGLKRGGVLNIVRHDVEVYCPYDKIPRFFEISLEGLEIGRSIHISAVKMPDGVSPVIKNRDFTVATIAGALKGDDESTTTAATDAAAAPAGDAKAGSAPTAGAKAAPAAAAGGKAAAAAPAGKAAAPAAKPAAKK
jgi:large subunit ribosomal protein L25